MFIFSTSIANRNDLADRSLIVNLPRIPEDKRKLERELWKEFRSAKPEILGALLDAVSIGLRNIDNVKLDTYTRMADFAQWIVAMESILPWSKGKFLEVYKKNRDQAVLSIFESDVVAIALKEFIEDKENWEGTATDLKKDLESYVRHVLDKPELINDKTWPKMPNYLSNRVRRIAPSLLSIGINAEDVIIKGRKIWRIQLDKP